MDVFKEGLVIEFSVYHALLDHCLRTPSDDFNKEVITPVGDHFGTDLSGGTSSDPVPVVQPVEVSSDGNPNPLKTKTWKITYSTAKDLDRGRMKAYDGSLSLAAQDGWLSLKNAKGKIVGCRYVESKDKFSVGAKLIFPIHVVRLGPLIPVPKTKYTAPCMAHADFGVDSKETLLDVNKDREKMCDSIPPTTTAPAILPSLSVHEALNLGFNFSHGKAFAREMDNMFNRTVHPSDLPGHFQMVVSFGRATFKLEEDMVGLALEAVLGGHCERRTVAAGPPKQPGVILPESFVTETFPPITFGTMKHCSFFQKYSNAQEVDVAVAEDDGNSNNPQALKDLGQTNGVEQVNIPGKEEAQLDFDNMIDQMVYKVWACGRCLHMGHLTKDCTNEVRCKACYSYGHIKRNCLGNKSRVMKWIPKLATFPSLTKTDSSVLGSSSNSSHSKYLDSGQYSPRSTSPPPPQLEPTHCDAEDSLLTMASFEVDPLPWLPWGHQVIDGGPTRLPRSFYFAPQDPPSLHQDYCIALLDTPPPPAAEAMWREQVHDFLVGPLQRNVVSAQGSLFGVGLFQMSSPNSVNALVQHGQFQIQNRMLRFLHVGESPKNHRAAVGFRRGWLMFVGMHPDYRNNLDIANAVSTFGQYHTWNNNDPIKERVLVYASFPSPHLVPRDVVFGRFATVGGARESWTVPVFILSADFADVLPADEDQMPPDGNPHPLPGQLLQNNNLFVNPQFPEIGWDAVQIQENVQQGNDDHQNLNEEVIEQEEPESMIFAVSQGSESSVNQLNIPNGLIMHHQLQQHNEQEFLDIINVGMVTVHFGPVLPPDLLWSRLMERILPDVSFKSVPDVILSSPFLMLQRKVGFSLVDAMGTLAAGAGVHHTALICTGAEEMVEKQLAEESYLAPCKERKKRGVKVKPIMVQPSERRFTRSCLKIDGYRPAPVLAVQPKIRKKSRSKFLLSESRVEDLADSREKEKEATEQGDIPQTPIHIMQQVGISLGIAAEKLTKELLEADPSKQEQPAVKDD
ncbi:hypothetical protein ACQ4PT_014228 [Festuca glaucescens]